MMPSSTALKLKMLFDLILPAHDSFRVYVQVGEYCSDGTNYDDSWDKRIWSRELSKREVLVMTPQVLWNMLQHSFIRMGNIALICFDECHHARKNHPYNRIMQV